MYHDYLTTKKIPKVIDFEDICGAYGTLTYRIKKSHKIAIY